MLISGKKTTIGVSVEPISEWSIPSGRSPWLAAALHRRPVKNDVLHDHDRVIDHQSAGCGEPSERHHVEALTMIFITMNVTMMVTARPARS